MASTAHLNFKGHHPRIRPHIPHWCGKLKIKKMIASSLDATTPQEPLFVEMGCGDTEAWYVDTKGCGMLQANDAEPPPKHGWLHKAVQCAAVFLIGLMVLTGTFSCHKDPQPAPNPIPTDTITPVTPGDTLPDDNDTIVQSDTLQPGNDTVVPGHGDDTLQPGTYDPIPGRTVILRVDHPAGYGLRFPSMDTVRYYANHPGCDTIFIKWYVPLNYTVQWTPGVFHVAFDSLERYYNETDKCYGARDIVDSEMYGGASIPDEELLTHSKYGMTISDSIRCTNWGYNIRRNQNGKSYTPYNGNRVLKAGRSH